MTNKYVVQFYFKRLIGIYDMLFDSEEDARKWASTRSPDDVCNTNKEKEEWTGLFNIVKLEKSEKEKKLGRPIIKQSTMFSDDDGCITKVYFALIIVAISMVGIAIVFLFGEMRLEKSETKQQKIHYDC